MIKQKYDKNIWLVSENKCEIYSFTKEIKKKKGMTNMTLGNRMFSNRKKKKKKKKEKKEKYDVMS